MLENQRGYTYEDASVKRSWFKVIVAREAHNDGDRVCVVQSCHAEREHGVDGFATGKYQQPKCEGKRCIEPDGIYWSLRERVHAVEPRREWEGRISREGEGLTTSSQQLILTSGKKKA